MAQSVVERREALPDLTARLRKGEAVRILAIGSSSTFGTGASSPERSYPALLEVDLRTRWRSSDIVVTNAGIPGERAQGTIARIEAAIVRGGADLVIWQVGTNDALSGAEPQGFRDLVRRGIEAVRAAKLPLVLVDQQYYPGIRDLASYEAFVRIVAEVAGEHGVPVFLRYALMRAWGERSPEMLASALASDGFHMGDGGYDCLADLMAEALEPSRNPVALEAAESAPEIAAEIAPEIASAPALPTP